MPQYPVQWRRCARARRVGLRIDPALGHVIVTLPPRIARRVGVALLARHADWVAERLAALPPAVAFVDGTLIRVAGRRTRIRHLADDLGPTRLRAGALVVGGEPALLAGRVGAFLLLEARARFGALVARKAGLIGLSPRRIVMKDMRTRWGSCSAGQTVAFNWRLVMAPPFVQDYVVAHEMAHLRHMDHGPQFRALEHELSRHVEAARVWLHHHGAGLLRIG